MKVHRWFVSKDVGCRLAVLFAIGCALLSQDSRAQTQLKVRGPFLARDAAVTFPERVGAFQRVSIILYTPDSKNLSAGYNLMDPSNPVVATVYIYPARRVLSFGSPRNVVDEAHDKLEEMEMDSVIHEILNAHRGAQLLDQGRINVSAGGRILPGRHARFAYQDVLFERKQPVVGHVWLFTVGKWYLKYRVSCPAQTEAPALNSVRKLMTALPVPAA